MKKYEYGRIEILENQLLAAGIEPEIIIQVMQDAGTIKSSTSPEKKADWMREAMQRMDVLLDPETRQSVRQACACCLGGKRLEISKGIAKNHSTLAERIEAANQAGFVFGHSVHQQEDGRIVVNFYPEDQTTFRCVCLPKAKEPISITYCYCCGGHVKHHLQIALGEHLKMDVRSSALSSGGTQGCSFEFEIE
jgi:hypothetical protein